MKLSKRKINRFGFTLVEMMMTVVIVSVVVLGLANVMAEAHRSYAKMYERVHGNVVSDAYFARLRFDKVCRMAARGDATLDTSTPSLKVLYYSVPNVSWAADLEPNSFATFYLSGSDLMFDTGTIGAAVTTTEIIASNVTELQFSVPVDGRNAQMIMTLADASNSITVTCSSVMHN